eukprot:GILJ01007462.1.p1 GENE.GILJ01007462.1~~GILJ01007462.1.p1  ORF type:complete len:518 (-),score=65.61 GILJ01007462.1:1629-3182(-)
MFSKSYQPVIQTASKLPAQNRTNQQNLFAQLPVELQHYIVDADPHAKIDMVTWNPVQRMIRKAAVLALLPWAFCRMELVREGELALTWNGDKPEVLGPGRHVLFKPTNSLDRIVKISDPVIVHGPISIIRVQDGQLGYGLDTETGHPVLLSPGKHVINSPTFKFQRFLVLDAVQNDIGTFTLIRIETGNVGIAYRNAELKVLGPGFHLIVPPDRFRCVVSTQQCILELPHMLAESSDYVQLAIKADVFYRIVDPEKTFSNIKDIDISIRETAVATLCGIIRNSTLAEIGQSAKATYNKVVVASGGGGGEVSAPPYHQSFYKYVHDQFIETLHDHVMSDWGVSIENIRIESLKIANERLAQDISSQAVIYAKTQAALANAQSETQVQAAAAERNANTVRIDAQAKANAIETEAVAKANALSIEADAKAKTIKILAEADAEATRLRAGAERERLRLEGEGKGMYMKSLDTEFGQKLALFDVQATAFKNTEKIAWLPPNTLPPILTSNMFGSMTTTSLNS